MPRRTALIVAVPEAEPFVGALRHAHDPSAALGAPAHITILFPFASPQSVDEVTVGELIGTHEAFDYRLTGVAVFADGATYLTPEPAEPFIALTNAVAARWPEHPPYGGAFETVIPHLTVSTSAPVAVDAPFPISARAEHVVLIEEDDHARWAERRRFALGPAP
jgi:2'-5' RNA ligase